MNRAGLIKGLRTWPVLATIAIVVVGLLVWLFAYFVPQGKKLSSLKASETQLQSEQLTLEGQLAQLKHDSAESPALLARQAQLTTAVPPDAEVFTYIQQISEVASASGVTINSLAPGTVAAPTATSTSSGSAAPSNYSVIPITLAVTATYDSELNFLKNIYAMPRLTVVNSLSLSGGGPKTTRSTPLAVSMSMTIFTTAPATVAPAN
jgi:type IV pilus assembly protein PilO